MSINDRIKKLCRICGDVGSIHIFGLIGQLQDLSEKINTLLPINVRIFNTYTLSIDYYKLYHAVTNKYNKYKCFLPFCENILLNSHFFI